jgi:hypothetical protein
MSGALPWPGEVALSAQALADAAVRLHEDKLRWTDAQQAGVTLLHERYRHAIHGSALIERLQECRDNLPALRRANFTGSMLRHHLHKSTQYMAQWIEAKNHNS